MADLLINIKVQGGKEASSALDSIQAAAKKATSSIGSFQEQAKKTQGVTNKSVQEAVKLSNKLNELALSEKAVAKGINELNKGLISSTQFTNRYGKAVSNLKAEIRNSYGANLQYEKSINQVNEALKKSSISTNKFSGILKTVKAAAIGYATVLATMELQQFVSGTISAGIAIDSLRRSFVAITGDAKSAAQQIKFLRGTADELGLTYTSLEKSYKDILAASKGTSLEGQGVEKIFIAISKASAVLGMSVDETQGALRALSQMISKGNVQAEELRGQLGERLPGAFQKAARAMGVTTQKLNDMLENGEVLAEDLIPKLADVLEDDFARAAVNASQRAQASFNKLSNSVQKFQETIGEAGLTNFFANLANVSADALNSLNKLLGDEEPTDRLKRRISEAETVLAELRGEVESNQLDIWGKYKSAIEAAAKASGDFVELDLEDMTQAQIENRLEVDKLTLSYLELEKVIKKFPSRTSISEQIGDSENRAKEIIAIRKELSVLSSDDTNQQMEKSIAAAEKTKNELIARAKNSATVRKEIEDWFQKEKIKIEQDAAKKRQDIVDKENKAIEKENNERLKNEKKLLQQLFDEYDIATKVLNNRKKFNKELSKLQKSAFDYQKDLIEEEKKEWIAKGISAIDAEKSANKKFEKLYKERADAARSAALSIYGDTGTTNDNYWSLRADDIDAYIEKLYDMGVSEAAITAASKKKWQEYNDDKAKADNDFLASIKAGLHEYQKEYETLGEHLSDIAHTAASGMESAFSDTLFDALKGDIDDISRVWESFMDDMLRSLTDTVADMAIQWGVGAIGTATGWWDSGAWEVKKDHVAVVHAGEMIVPADVASIIRSGKPTDESQIDELAKVSPSGGHEWSSSDKSRLTGLMNTPTAQNKKDTAELSALDSKSLESATRAAVRSMAMSAAQGISLTAQGAISTADLAAGLLGPSLGTAAISGVTGYVKDQLGVTTSNWGTVGSFLGSLTGAFTGTGLVGATLGDLAGSYAGMRLGDLFNARNEEETRDLLEDAFGWAEGLRVYAQIAAQSKKTVAETLKSYGWDGQSTISNSFGSDSGRGGFDSGGIAGSGTVSIGRGTVTMDDGSTMDVGGLGGSSGRTTGNSSGGRADGSRGSAGNAGSSDSDNGYATGGVIDSLMVPYGEDGWAAVQFGEGVISKEGMKALEKLNEGNLKDFYPTYDSNLENIISITNSIQKAVYEALGRDIPTTLTLQDAGIVLESDNMTKVTELFDSIREGGIDAEELETAYQSFIGVGLSAADASSATQELITAYTKQENIAIALASTVEGLNDIINKNTLSDYEYDLLQLSEWYNDQTTLANELGTSIELVNEAYDVQAQIIEDDLLDKINSFNDSIQDIIDDHSLSDYEISLKSLNEWYDEQKEEAEDLGIDISNLTKAYYLQKAALDDLSVAQRIVSLAISGSLTASEQFAEWQIKNAEALSLYQDLTAASVTQKELEGAIDAFVELGLEGDDLNTVIEDLADRFTETTNQMLKNISNIESAQSNLAGNDSDEYLTEIASALSFFQTIPSMAQIRGDETIERQVLDEESYQRAIAEYVVNSEFQNILGRGTSGDYWVDALLNGDVSFGNLSEAIINGISDDKDVVNEIFMRLFGRTAASNSPWFDVVSSYSSTSDLESDILTGASAVDAAYYEANRGLIESTEWVDFATAAIIAGISEADFMNTQSITMGGEFSTSEAEVMEAIAVLKDLPEVITNGTINETALTEFVDTITNMNAGVIEDIFGADAAGQINSLASAVNDYYNSIEDAVESAVESTEELVKNVDFLNKGREYSIDLLELLGNEELVTSLKRQQALNELKEEFGENSSPLVELLESVYEVEDAVNILTAAEEAYTDALKDNISEVEDTISDLEGLLEGIADFRDEIISTNNAFDPEQGLNVLKSNLDDIVKGLLSGENTQEYLEDLTSVGSKVLSAGSEIITDVFESRKNTFDVIRALNLGESVGGEALSNEEQQLIYLREQLDAVLGVEDTNKSIEELEKEYFEAKTVVDRLNHSEIVDYWAKNLHEMESSNVTLSNILNAIGNLAFGVQYGVDSSLENKKKEDYNISVGEAALSAIQSSTGVRPNELVSGTLTAKLNQMAENGTYSGLAAAIAASAFSTEIRAAASISDLSDILSPIGSFSEGGTVVGPASGYTVPVTFHGTEHIIPDGKVNGLGSDNSDVVELLSILMNLSGDHKKLLKDIKDFLKRNAEGVPQNIIKVETV